MTTKQVTDDAFETEVLKADGPVLVDFWAEWCGPCKQLSPVLDELAGEFEGKVQVAKVNIDQNPETPQKYGVRGIPTLMVFRDGEAVATKVGSMPKGQLSEWLESVTNA
ncbi:MAG: thiol reductase thioredoxin [Rickettsiales bacterium]|nr:thiol reductase thioredoxin [Rickettsiales bacterium]|tara:strand:- start:484 stop:810 length:327 start_codon:yes stop_codon:yes gene_type:complete